MKEGKDAVGRILEIDDERVLGADVVQQGDGRHLVHEFPGGARLFALVESSNLTRYEVEGVGPGVDVRKVTEEGIAETSEGGGWHVCTICEITAYGNICLPILCETPVVAV
jgi:hypothetical protein